MSDAGLLEQVRAAADALKAQLGRGPSRREIAARLGWSGAKLGAVLRHANGADAYPAARSSDTTRPFRGRPPAAPTGVDLVRSREQARTRFPAGRVEISWWRYQLGLPTA